MPSNSERGADVEYVRQHWDGLTDVLTLLLWFISILVGAGFFIRQKRAAKDLIYVEQERDNLKKTLAATQARHKTECAVADRRLNLVDPDRFITQAKSLTDAAKVADLERLAIDFTTEQTPAIGLAAENSRRTAHSCVRRIRQDRH